jgi:hypothetical protein
VFRCTGIITKVDICSDTIRSALEGLGGDS